MKKTLYAFFGFVVAAAGLWFYIKGRVIRDLSGTYTSVSYCRFLGFEWYSAWFGLTMKYDIKINGFSAPGGKTVGLSGVRTVAELQTVGIFDIRSWHTYYEKINCVK